MSQMPQKQPTEEPKAQTSETRRYSSVRQMVGDLCDDKDFVKSLETRIRERQIVKSLMAMRAGCGLSQKDIADCFGCSQSRISKLENGTDEDLHLNDMYRYLKAVGFELRLVFAREGQTLVDEVKHHAFCIKTLLDRMAAFADRDEEIAEAVAVFYGEAFLNLVKIVQDSSQRLPAKPDTGEPYIRIEIQDDRGCQESGLSKSDLLRQGALPKQSRQARLAPA